MINAKLAKLEASIAKDSLIDFVEMAWPIAYKGERFSRNWHHELICNVLEAVTRGELHRVIINIPPGCSKSSIVSIFWPVWEWLQKPTLRQAFASYDETTISLRDSTRAAELIESSWFVERFGILVPKGQAKGDYYTHSKGRRFSTSIGGALTGNHFDRLVVDDPCKPLQLDGELLLRPWKWWQSTASTRIQPGGAVVVVAQRLHALDLPGQLMKSGDEWHVLALPMRATLPEARYRSAFGEDPRVAQGELLWPARFTPEHVASLARSLGPLGAAAQLDQRPAPPEGAVLQAGWFRRGDPPMHDTPSALVYSVDCAFKAGDGNDRVAVQLWARHGADCYLVERHTARRGFSDTLVLLRSLANKRKNAKFLIEDAANGPAVIDVLRREIPGVIPCKPLGGKIARANSVAGYIQSGNVVLAPGDAGDGLIAECVEFPVGEHDDDVDAMSQALAYLFGLGAGLGAIDAEALAAFERQWRMG